eukprot:m.430099 g.430099  ORF g.430099 m.430099 type:complete len:979 (+) comp17115_c0_seq1:3514-6450(+)
MKITAFATLALVACVRAQQINCNFPGGSWTGSTCGFTETGGTIWATRRGSTPSTNTGPSRDQSGSTSNYYAYAETSCSGTLCTAPSYLTSRALSGAPATLSFYYHMYGNTMGTLTVQYCTTSPTTCFNFASNSQWRGQQQTSTSAAWTRVQHTLPSSARYIRFIALRGSGFRSDMAIDNIVVTGAAVTTSSPTRSPTSSLPIGCTFSTGTCGFNLGGQWTRLNRGTPSFATGPNFGSGGTGDYYVFLETSSGGTGALSTMTTPYFRITSASTCTFKYHMFGASIGSLEVMTCTGLQGTTPTCARAWYRSGAQTNTQGSPFSDAAFTVPVGTTTIQFRGRRGSSFTGDIAVDAINIFSGTPPPTSAPTPTPQCPALPASATVQTVVSSPSRGCIGGGGPSMAAHGTCYVSNGGTCITDGPGVHGNGERCVFTVLQDGYVYPSGPFLLEGEPYDYLTINGSRPLDSESDFVGYRVSAGENITWRSDGSVTYTGFTLCVSTTTAPTPAVFPFSCAFNSGTSNLCGMSNDNRWSVRTRNTPSFGTGPNMGQAGTTTDRYAFVETSTSSNYTSTLQTPWLGTIAQTAFGSFYYHMYGLGIQTLIVETCAQTVCTPVLTLVGEQHATSASNWTQATFVVPIGTTQVQWKAVNTNPQTSLSGQGDISIDTIVIAAGTAPPTPSPVPLPACNPMEPAALFQVIDSAPVRTCSNPNSAATGTCYVTNGATCFTDGPNSYSSNERCTIRVLLDTILYATDTYRLGDNDDFLTVNGTRLASRTTFTNMSVSAGEIITWRTDTATISDGFNLCGVIPTPAPTAAPTSQPTGSPTAPTASPTMAPSAVPTFTPTASPTAVPSLTPTAAPTSAPAAPTNAGSAASGGSSSGGGGILLYIIIAAAVLIVLIAGIIIYKKNSGGGAGAAASDMDRNAFDNPIYDDETDGNFADNNDGGYNDVSGANNDDGGYLDVNENADDIAAEDLYDDNNDF